MICLKSESVKIKTYLNWFRIICNNFSIHFFASSSCRRRFSELYVTHATIFFRLFVLHNPDIFNGAKLFECGSHVFRRVLFTTDYENTRKRRAVHVYTARNWARIHTLLITHSHLESFESSSRDANCLVGNEQFRVLVRPSSPKWFLCRGGESKGTSDSR